MQLVHRPHPQWHQYAISYITDNNQVLYIVYVQKSVCIYVYTQKNRINKTRLEIYQMLRDV